MIQLQRVREVIDSDDVGRLASAFASHNCVHLPGLLDAELQTHLQPHLEQDPWISRTHDGIGADDILADGIAARLLSFLTNSRGFLRAACDIGGCVDVTEFTGEVYRLAPGSGHYDSWHDDVKGNSDGRLLGMSINLSARPYEGGIFQMRETESRRIIFQIANTGWGDATLFRLSSRFEHQVTPVTGHEPRVAFAGWFGARARAKASPRTAGR